jgi:N-acetyl-gamma-glutamylphosphate reductase
LLEAEVRVIDLAGDFRLPAEAYPQWYGFDHPGPNRRRPCTTRTPKAA